MIKIPKPKDLEFEGTGHKGAAFEQKGLSERNLQNLLETLSDKTAQKSVQALSKIDKDEWSDMASMAGSMQQMSAMGGVVMILASTFEQFLEDIQNSLKAAVAPALNEIYAILNTWILPGLNLIMPYVAEGIHWVGEGIDFVMEGLWDLGVFIGNQILEIAYQFSPGYDPNISREQARENEIQRQAKARRARYQTGNVPGTGGRGSGLQSGSGSIGSPPSPPSSGSGRGGGQE